MEPFVMPPDTLLVEEDGVVTGVTREFYDEHQDKHAWTVVAEGDLTLGLTDPAKPSGSLVPATL